MDAHDTIAIVSVGADDGRLLRGVAELLVAAARRLEAVGLLPTVTPDAYLERLCELMGEAARGDGGLLAAVDATGRVVGSVQWRRSPYATRRIMAEIQKVCVAPTARGRSLGKALIERVAVDSAAAGVELLTLDVRGNNRAALAMYENCGFTRAGLWPNAVADGDVRHDIISMARELSRPPEARLMGSLAVGAGASLLRGEQRTQRLLLCRPSASDVKPSGIASARQFEAWERDWARHGLGYWTARSPSDGQVVGVGGVRPRAAREGSLSLHCRLRPAFRGHGYAQELGRAALELAAGHAPGRPVIAAVAADNGPGVRLAERLGLHADGATGACLRYRSVPR